ncbi:MAG: hypothetical protein AUJ49_08655 [Desulfovibrionaceae bacterium CG1_02_65_16]|nr:MAG: hypothetical protein AUJ49_08655 [Desulfovibrionaceae bacterium CG1_02_65_16]
MVTRKNSSSKPKVSELRARFEFVKASFAVEDIHFTTEELYVMEQSIRKRHRGPGFITSANALLKI